jgi:wyosine [tRNA(Phe)-imidazoG37] synthetase (radical SAM superfamily)
VLPSPRPRPQILPTVQYSNLKNPARVMIAQIARPPQSRARQKPTEKRLQAAKKASNAAQKASKRAETVSAAAGKVAKKAKTAAKKANKLEKRATKAAAAAEVESKSDTSSGRFKAARSPGSGTTPTAQYSGSAAPQPSGNR